MDAPPDRPLCRKEIAALFQRDRITVYRWEREGLRLVDGRASAMEIVWFLEQRDAARKLGMKTIDFLSKSREVRVKLLAAAFLMDHAPAESS